MRQHMIPAAIATCVSLLIGAGVAHYAPVKQIQVTHSIAASKHAWPDMTTAEKAQLALLAKDLPKAIKIDIVCNDAGCSDLAADIDDAFEDAGIDSVIDKAIGPLGYGIGIASTEFDKNEAAIVANIISASTGLQPVLTGAKSAPGYITILIGKRPR